MLTSSGVAVEGRTSGSMGARTRECMHARCATGTATERLVVDFDDRVDRALGKGVPWARLLPALDEVCLCVTHAQELIKAGAVRDRMTGAKVTTLAESRSGVRVANPAPLKATVPAPPPRRPLPPAPPRPKAPAPVPGPRPVPVEAPPALPSAPAPSPNREPMEASVPKPLSITTDAVVDLVREAGGRCTFADLAKVAGCSQETVRSRVKEAEDTGVLRLDQSRRPWEVCFPDDPQFAPPLETKRGPARSLTVDDVVDLVEQHGPATYKDLTALVEVSDKVVRRRVEEAEAAGRLAVARPKLGRHLVSLPTSPAEGAPEADAVLDDQPQPDGPLDRIARQVVQGVADQVAPKVEGPPKGEVVDVTMADEVQPGAPARGRIFGPLSGAEVDRMMDGADRGRAPRLTRERAGPPIVIVESPYRGANAEERRENEAYARRLLRSRLLLGEAAVASHVTYTLDGVLDEDVPDERRLGIEAGLALLRVADRMVVGLDRGVSEGVLTAIKRAEAAGVDVGFVWLEPWRAFANPGLVADVMGTLVTRAGRAFASLAGIRAAEAFEKLAQDASGMAHFAEYQANHLQAGRPAKGTVRHGDPSTHCCSCGWSGDVSDLRGALFKCPQCGSAWQVTEGPGPCGDCEGKARARLGEVARG